MNPYFFVAPYPITKKFNNTNHTTMKRHIFFVFLLSAFSLAINAQKVADKRVVRDLELSTDEQELKAGQSYEIPITAQNLGSVQGFQLSGIGIVVHVVEHYSYHTGQISFWTKQLKNKDLRFYAGLDLNVQNNG